MDQLEKLKNEFESVLNDGKPRDILHGLVDDDYVFVGREAGYMVMADCYGRMQYYNPTNDTIIPFIERRENYGK